MSTQNYLSRLFGSSPIAPLQAHMQMVHSCVNHLIGLFEAMQNNDLDAVTDAYHKIAELEQKADDQKHLLRDHLPKSLFMPIARQDLLDALRIQDKLANRARDIAGIVVGRKMRFPETASGPMLDLVKATVATVSKTHDVVNELDELVETGFRGRAVRLVENMLIELDRLESETDRIQVDIRAALFQVEKDLPAVDVMFMYRVIESVAKIADDADRVGRRFQMMLAN